MPDTLTEQIKLFIEERYRTKREALDKEYEKATAKAVTSSDAEDVEVSFAAKREKLAHDFNVQNWLDVAAKKASKISIETTHLLKFIHSSAKGTNFLDARLGRNPKYLDTESLIEPTTDVAVENAAALDVAGLLQLKDSAGLPLFHYFKQGDASPLSSLATNASQLAMWQEGLGQALKDAKPSSHSLGKQVYFLLNPGEEQSEYHLLAPLYSSSLSQALYDEIHHVRFSQEMKAARDAKKSQLPYHEPVVVYPNLALTIAGGSKPQNVSQLNSGRGGRNYLFSSCPPKWESQYRSIVKSNNVFTLYEVRKATQSPIRRIVKLLNKVNEADIDSNMRIRNYLKSQVEESIDHILGVVGSWQQLPAGWSNEAAELPPSQRQWLDPENPEWDKHDDQWRDDVSHTFATWLKDSVNYYNKGRFILGAADVAIWQSDFKQALREAM